ncbi:protein ImuB [Marmoricola sp. OAE513]|uniref:DNA polymerase Y family protein n=1 Tax=Marmoricola sp. OAE513 TaxID=2817894 RepID=UPI001AE72A8F
MSERSRALVLWCPDWPVVAALADGEIGSGGTGSPGKHACAVVTRSAVEACNDLARDHGVRRGMRRRDAQSRCPELRIFDANPDRDVRAFEPVLAAVEELRPGVAPLRPGLLAIRAPGRFYGGEENAAATIAERLVELGVWDVRIGVADDLFSAEQAARRAELQGWKVIEEGGSSGFLKHLSVDVLDDAELVGLLQRLGLRTLGDLAALPARDVLTRFGAYGAKVHRLARGVDPVQPATRKPPPELVGQVVFEPALVSVEAVSFSVRRTAEAFVANLAKQGLVCTALRVEAEADDAKRTVLSSRAWVHSRWFAAADVVDRVHWQLQATPTGVLLGAPVGLVRFIPETVEPAAAHADGLWGGGTDERVDRGVARVQAMLGYDSVVVPVRQGGRTPADRQLLVPWGERPTGVRKPDLPWPGSIPSPAPSRVFAEPWATSVVGANGQPVSVTDRGVLTSVPTRFHSGSGSGWQAIDSWAGPWPVDEQWWEASGRGLVARFQIVGVDGRAWLMRCDASGWWTEASYD